MGSLPRLEDEVKFVITGFSQFYGVTNNPTEEIANDLGPFWETVCQKVGSADSSCLFDCATLRVSADACDQYLSKMCHRVKQELTDQKVVWIHLGVDPGAREMALETQAVNNASFLSPDEDGCQFMYQYIEAEFPYNEKILSKINIDAVIERLSEKGVHVKKSCDAGRFVCNYIYFRSLRQAELLKQPNWYSVFVHVPSFHHVSKEAQLDAIASMMQVIGEHITSESNKQSKTRLATSTV